MIDNVSGLDRLKQLINNTELHFSYNHPAEAAKLLNEMLVVIQNLLEKDETQ
jgi:hypothetical protein